VRPEKEKVFGDNKKMTLSYDHMDLAGNEKGWFSAIVARLEPDGSIKVIEEVSGKLNKKEAEEAIKGLAEKYPGVRVVDN
jgi:hypothetical protein